MTVAGIGSVVATVVVMSNGDICPFDKPEKLASYFGLTPRVRQSGDRAAFHGKISKQGNATARTMLIEAAWTAASVPGLHLCASGICRDGNQPTGMSLCYINSSIMHSP